MKNILKFLTSHLKSFDLFIKKKSIKKNKTKNLEMNTTV